MVRSTAIPLLILAAISLTPTGVSAANITYDVVNYPDLQNGFTVSGTITTDGTTGIGVFTHFVDWDITITDSSGQKVLELTPFNTQTNTGPIDITPTQISIASPGDILLFESASDLSTHITWENFTRYSAGAAGTTFWSTTTGFNAATNPVATVAAAVPEPSSAVLASIGAVAASFAYGRSRHRRAQRRQTAA